ncbi:MAG: hypothetical protein Q8S73_26515 [Deltaproteobacteria bacterium]|nr:hypothetical protein [Myxococcales bacterium]MDP3217689.1 hypothetical protein [Deltaproteobacteria bacterium]
MANRIAPRLPAIDPTETQVVSRRKVEIPAAAFAANGSTDSLYVGECGVLRVTQTCASRTGTNPTCDVTVMTCDTPGGTFYAAGTFTQLTAAGAQRKAFAVDRWVRFDVALGGTNTPTFTLSFDGEAVGG